jgi:para-nitrobenzyl esterase
MRVRPVISAAAVAALALGLVLTASPAGAADRLTVHTRAGDVRGIANGTVDEWRGVPYAAPPVGAQRWRPPSAVPGWRGVRSAQEFAPDCLQLESATTTSGSEDCLYLNVFTPTRPRGPLPVLVYLHGGGNFFGGPYTETTAMTSRGVLVVTVASRLGVMGFAGHPALTREGNGSSGEYGVLDQIAALHWVQANIAGFGGDPDNVTLGGESAGSFDAVAIAASPLGKGLFRRLIVQTESVFAWNGLGKIRDAEDIGKGVADAVGCAGAARELACLRSKAAVDLAIAAGPGDVAPWVGGAVLSAPPQELFARMKKPPPMLLGSNREEAVFFFDIPPPDPYGQAEFLADTDALVGADHGDRARRLYPLASYDSLYWNAVGMFTDVIYTCPIRDMAGSGGSVYRYLYAHTFEGDEVNASLRAAHFGNEPMLWHNGDLIGGYDFTPAEDRLAGQMATYWTSFVKTGDPNGSGLPSWPRYSNGKEQSLVLDDRISVVSRYQRQQCQFLDRLPDVFPADE